MPHLLSGNPEYAPGPKHKSNVWPVGCFVSRSELILMPGKCHWMSHFNARDTTKTMPSSLDYAADDWSDGARMAQAALSGEPATGIPTMWLNVMDVPLLEEMTGNPPGSYAIEPERVYIEFQREAGVCAIDQFIPENPATMSNDGFGAEAPRRATTGAAHIECDGMVIDSPEAVAEHLERQVFPGLQREIDACENDPDGHVHRLVAGETAVQGRFGQDMLKVPYGSEFLLLPCLRYGLYGYEHYLTAYLVYPEIMERDFALQADLAERRNTLSARAMVEGRLPRIIRADHDMADSRGTLVDVASLDRIWFPHFARAIRPLLDVGVRVIWHCDGNLMDMVPRLIEAGISGFQGFQYEAGMDYQRICAMKDRQGRSLLIWAGVSVTRTLPFGTPADVRRELDWLATNGPKTGLFLGASSSITPGTSHENIRALLAGLKHYREVKNGNQAV